MHIICIWLNGFPTFLAFASSSPIDTIICLLCGSHVSSCFRNIQQYNNNNDALVSIQYHISFHYNHRRFFCCKIVVVVFCSVGVVNNVFDFVILRFPIRPNISFIFDIHEYLPYRRGRHVFVCGCERLFFMFTCNAMDWMTHGTRKKNACTTKIK